MKRIVFALLLLGLCAGAEAQFQPVMPGAQAQFQPVVPGAQMGYGAAPREFMLPPGGSERVVAYCGQLLNDPPTDRDSYLPGPNSGTVTLADGAQMELSRAVQGGILAMRGPGPRDPARPARALWIALYVVNRAPFPVGVNIPAGALFQPAARTEKPAATPGGTQRTDVATAPAAGILSRVQAAPATGGPSGGPVVYLVSAMAREGMAGSDLACLATWAATGSTRADLEHALARVLTDRDVEQINRLLAASGAPVLKEGAEEYTARYDKALKELGEKPAQSERSFRFPSGLIATLTVQRGPEGHGVLQARTREEKVLSYGAEVSDGAMGGWRVRLLNLKTGRPVSGVPDITFEAPK